jgi:hypothetical protein
MRVGATISPKYMEVLQSIYTKIPVSPKYSLPICDSGFRGPMKKQFEVALAHYKNDGTPYDFYAERCGKKGCDKAQDELNEGQSLKKCGRCREASYCSKDCQAADWRKHKKSCHTPEEREENERKMSERMGGIKMLNV